MGAFKNLTMNFWHFFAVTTVFLTAKAEEKSALQRLDQLRAYHKAWVNEWLKNKQVEHWEHKFTRNADRLALRYAICGAKNEENLDENKNTRKKRQTETTERDVGKFVDKLFSAEPE